MPIMDENTKIQRITHLLERGGTMLATHHDCGAPLFRYQGKVLCPVCEYGDGDDKKAGREPETPRKVEIRKEAAPGIKQQGDYYQIAFLTKNKVQSVAESLENETDLQRVKDKMECIELGIKILKLLEGG
ncbi:Sjogren's syndrome/scleroderma autoantigen 1 (Autoantigen p27) [uncultured archaeon]|nr:Sjogren's syndrome/scleroderma autoantigen 1 (Autoantigen p27) [uncultured archaeon]